MIHYTAVTQLLLVLLVVYAIVIMAALSFLFMFLVRRAAKSRLRLFSIFTSLPRPTVMALASQSISVTGTVFCSQLVHGRSLTQLYRFCKTADIAGGHAEDEEEEAWQQANVRVASSVQYECECDCGTHI